MSVRIAALGVVVTCASTACWVPAYSFIDASGGSDNGVDAPINADAPPGTPTVTSLAIDQYVGADLEIPQGAGALDVTVTGQSLDTVVGASIGSLATGTPTATSTRVTFRVSVPHGAAIGPVPVTLMTSAGSTLLAGSFIITALTASNVGVDTGRGTTSHPFQTLTHALSVAASGDTVYLKDGHYNTGETWPTMDPSRFIANSHNVPTGVTVVGQSTNMTILAGPGVPSTVALTTNGGAAVRNLTIQAFEVGVLVDTGDAALDSVHILNCSREALLATQNATQITITGATTQIGPNQDGGMIGFNSSHLTMTDGRITGNTGGGATAWDSTVLTLTNVEVDHNGTMAQFQHAGVAASGNGGALTPTVVLDHCDIHDNFSAGIATETSSDSRPRVTLMGGTQVHANGRMGQISPWGSGITLTRGQGASSAHGGVLSVMAGCAIFANTRHGIVVDANDAPATVTLDGVDIHGNGGNGVSFDGPGSLSATRVSVHDNALSGVSISGVVMPAVIGTMTTLANNMAYQIRDDRIRGSGSISAAGTLLTCSGCTSPAAGTTLMGPVDISPMLKVMNVGNSIQF